VITSSPTNIDIKLAECLVDDLSVVIEHEKHLRSDLLAQVNLTFSRYSAVAERPYACCLFFNHIFSHILHCFFYF